MSRSSPQKSPLTDYSNVAAPASLILSFERHLRASRRRPDTVAMYTSVARRFHDFAAEQGFPPVDRLRREHVEAWLASFEGRSSHTQRDYFVVLRQWFRWLLDEGEIRANPMERMKPPALDEPQKDVVAPLDITAVLKALQREKNWRDLAIVSLLYDTGMRSGETCSLLIADVDFEQLVIRLRGTETKGRRGRVVPLSASCAAHLDRYLRKRRDTAPHLFVGQKGPLQRSGMYWLIRRAFEATGQTIGPHDLRHTSATHTAASLSENDRMLIYGWKDPAMARHYSRQAAQANAIAAHRKASPLEHLAD